MHADGIALAEASAIDAEVVDDMHLLTLVTRTPAGSAELAAPAHGLSLTQRRFLTLLDTAISVEELAVRQPSSAEKLERDLLRLASLGLVTCEMPAANDPTAEGRPERLHAWGTPRRIALVLAPLALVLLGVGAWRILSPPSQPAMPVPVVPLAQSGPPVDELPATVTPIATKVLRGEPDLPPTPRDGSRNAGARPAQRTPAPAMPPPPLPGD